MYRRVNSLIFLHCLGVQRLNTLDWAKRFVALQKQGGDLQPLCEELLQVHFKYIDRIGDVLEKIVLKLLHKTQEHGRLLRVPNMKLTDYTEEDRHNDLQNIRSGDWIDVISKSNNNKLFHLKIKEVSQKNAQNVYIADAYQCNGPWRIIDGWWSVRMVTLRKMFLEPHCYHNRL